MTVTVWEGTSSQSSSSTPSTYRPIAEITAELQLAKTTALRWIWNQDVVYRGKKRGKGFEIDVLSLPSKYKAAFLARHPELVAPEAPDEGGDSVSRYTGARRESVRTRAEMRLEAVLSFREARQLRGPSETFAEVEQRWLRNFRRTHPVMKASIRSVKNWSDAYAAQGLNGLVDGNDGSQQSRSRIPEEAKELFDLLYFRSHLPNLKLAYREVCIAAEVHGWGPMPTYKAFRRYAESQPNMFRLLNREFADSPREALPYVRRDPTSVPVYHTIQGDSRELDVPVRCGQLSCLRCMATKRHKARGHFPIWTVWIDTHSRRIVDWDLSIEAPNYRHILLGVRRMLSEHGSMKRLYVDNGGPFVRALGRLREEDRTRSELTDESRLAIQARLDAFDIAVTFAIPYNPQGKGAVESVFRTFRRRFDERFDSFRGERTEAAWELLRNPSELPTLSELAHLIQLSVDDYHHTAHHGLGMNGRTPNEVWSDPSLRLPHRTPDRKAFALLFYERIRAGRIVGQLGVRYDNRIYRLASLEKHFQYYGERVEVRIDPDDITSVILMDMKTGSYICEATLDDQLATYDTRDEVTRTLIARTFHDTYALRRMAQRAYTDDVKERLIEHARLMTAYYEQLRDERGVAAPRGVAAEAGGSLVFLSQLSHVARDRERALAEAANLGRDEFRLLLEADQLAHATYRDAVPMLALVAPSQDDADDDRVSKEQIGKRERGLCEENKCPDPVGESRILCPAHEQKRGLTPS